MLSATHKRSSDVQTKPETVCILFSLDNIVCLKYMDNAKNTMLLNTQV